MRKLIAYNNRADVVITVPIVSTLCKIYRSTNTPVQLVNHHVVMGLAGDSLTNGPPVCSILIRIPDIQHKNVIFRLNIDRRQRVEVGHREL